MCDRYSMIFALSCLETTTKPCHWISTPNGDQGQEWCPDCGRFKVRNLRRRDRRRAGDYILDGGWRTSHDSMPACAACGTLLDASLTDFGASQEMDHYEEHGLSGNPGVDALYLSEIIENLPSEDGRLEAAMSLAREVLTLSKHKEGGGNG